MSEDSALNLPFALPGGERVRAVEADRERYLKRLGAGLAVALVHAILLLALLTAGKIGEIQKVAPKEFLLILPQIAKQAEPVKPVVPEVPLARPILEPSTAITLPPAPPAAHSKTDVMQEIGKELACGAGSYENLSQAQREACKRSPWRFKKNAHGVIVLDTAPPPEVDITSGADAAERTQRTADPCLAAGNTHSECIHKTLFGR